MKQAGVFNVSVLTNKKCQVRRWESNSSSKGWADDVYKLKTYVSWNDQ